MPYKFNPITGQLDLVNTSSGSDPFITDGASGITKIRWQSAPGAILYDMTINDIGTVITTAVPASSSPIGLLLALTYS